MRTHWNETTRYRSGINRPGARNQVAGSAVLPIVLAILVSCAQIGCQSDGPGEAPGNEATQPNLILISIDTLRPDHLGCYGYERPTSATIDSLAQRGVVFDHAFAQASWTLPSHMSMFTSMYPHTHQVEDQGASLAEGIATAAEALSESGYSTDGFVSWIFLSSRFGFDRGFDRYDEIVPGRKIVDGRPKPFYPDVTTLVDSVLVNFVDAQPTPGTESPFYLFLHIFDPHIDYDPPLEYAQIFDPSLESTERGSFQFLQNYIAGRTAEVPQLPDGALEQIRALYDGEIRHVDDQLSRLFGRLRAQGLLENTIVMLTSDHGEEFMEHGSIEGHQWTLYDEVLHVPLIICFPDGRGAGTRFDPIVQTIDVAPTLLDLAGIPSPETFEGRSLRPILDGKPDLERATTFSQIKRYNQKWALRSREHKLIFTADTEARFAGPIHPGFELYELAVDPTEQDNRFAEGNATADSLKLQLQGWILEKGTDVAGDSPEMTEEEIERLRSVGYIN